MGEISKNLYVLFVVKIVYNRDNNSYELKGRMHMKKLVTISREYGSGGRLIGKIIADKLGVPFYDKQIIDRAASESGMSRDLIENAELRAKSSFSYSMASIVNFGDVVNSDPLSMNEKLFLAQFDVIREIGQTGEGVIVGRCADYVLRDEPGVTNVFIYADIEDRMKRCVDVYNENPEKVKEIVATYDKARLNYYNYHTCQKWGDFKNYNLSINSSYITEEEVANLIINYMEHRSYKTSEL